MLPVAQHHQLLCRPWLQEKALTSCCCFGQGTISAHVRLERDKAQPGEEVQVVVEVDNRSKQAVRKIEVGWRGVEVERRLLLGRPGAPIQSSCQHGERLAVHGRIGRSCWAPASALLGSPGLMPLPHAGVPEAGGRGARHGGPPQQPPPLAQGAQQGRPSRPAALHHAAGRAGQVGAGVLLCL